MRTIRPVAGSLAIVLLLSACGGADAPDDRALPATTEEGTSTDRTDGDAAADEAVATIEVEDPRSRMSPRIAEAAAIYLTLQNPTDTDDALVAASVSEEVAARVELHETYEMEATEDGDEGDMTGGGGMHGGGDEAAAPMMGMREIPSIAVPAGGRVELAPGGLHLMVMELVDDLTVGDVYDVTLEFERADPVTVSVEVREDV
jgi:periplasmic copper chaperone A